MESRTNEYTYGRTERRKLYTPRHKLRGTKIIQEMHYQMRVSAHYIRSCIVNISGAFISFNSHMPTNYLSYIQISVGCAKGSYYVNKEKTCKLCPPSFYQDAEVQNTCKPCPSNPPAVGIYGAKSEEECSGMACINLRMRARLTYIRTKMTQ